MEQIIRIRNRWDEIFNEKRIDIFVKIFGTVCMYFACFTLAKLFPFIRVFEEDPSILFALVMAALFFANETLAMIAYALVLFVAMSGGQAFAAILTGIMCLFVCGNSRFICALTALVPVLLMNINTSVSPLLSLNMGFFIFFISVYFNGKIANRTWQYAFPIYFTLAAYNFNLYGRVVKKFLATRWPKKAYEDVSFDPFDLFFKYAGFEKDFERFDLTMVIILVLINLAICYLIYTLISNKNINFLNLAIDVRDGIIFGTATVLLCIAMIIIAQIHEKEMVVPYLAIILQGILAYIITRPFASHHVYTRLSKKQSNFEIEMAKNAMDGQDFAKTVREDIHGVVSGYLMPQKFDHILMADRYPVNGILVYGKRELDKRLIVESVFEDSKIEMVYCKGTDLAEEFLRSEAISILQEKENSDKLCVIVIENVDALFNHATMTEREKAVLLKYFTATLGAYKTNKKVLFIMTTDQPENLPEELYNEGCIDKIVYGRQEDSVLLNHTYRLICPVGKGGGGLVYKAYHERLDAMVVVKKIINTFSNKNSYKAEAVALKSIKHMYLPKVYDVFEEKGEFYTVMDFVPGDTLQEEMKQNGPLPQRLVLKWGLQLCDALNYLHHQQPPIIHSDIKPGNIMLTPQGNICLIDFNISLIFDKAHSAVAVTPGYSPIEQYGNITAYEKMLAASGEKTASKVIAKPPVSEPYPISDETMPIDVLEIIPKRQGVKELDLSDYVGAGLSEKSDVYSLGATMYALLTGERPSRDFRSIAPLGSCGVNVSAELASAIDKAMSVNPEDRYQDVIAFQRALERIQL